MTATEPVAPAAQPDRTLVAPVRDQLDQARQSLGAVAQWLHGFWPAHLHPPTPAPAELRSFALTAADLIAARAAVEKLDPYPRLNADGPHVWVDVDLPGVRVHLAANRELWVQVFPGDELPEAD